MQHELDKFERAADHLIQVTERIDPDDPEPARVEIALGQAKRVRRESNLLVRALARLRDQSQPTGGTD